MKKVIVFGGSGFIGSHVVDELCKEGNDVTVFDIAESPYLPKEVKFIKGDILDSDKVNAAMSGNNIVYNFAGKADLDTAASMPVETITTNVIGNTNILEASRRHKIERFLFASTVYVYSNAGSFYRSSKQACELIVEDYHKQYNLDYTILRYGSLYGPRSNASNWIYSILKEALEKGKITRKGDGEEVREYVHVYDAARLSIKILDSEYKNQCVMITGNQQTRIKDLMLMIKEMLNNEIELVFLGVNEEMHYEITPYNFSPKLAKKIVGDYYIDLGQGFLDTLNQIHKEKLIAVK
ncbi:MAG: NAD(P)-dependent oxidoreductase [Candidatus Orphnella occulta]|nr:NAD(P)-dependent oxidoreductase [Candidatus Orphnella occulta]